MSINVQNDFLTNVNRFFDNHVLNKASINEDQREKAVSRALALKNVGIDVTEIAKITGSFFREFSNVVLPGPDYSHPARLESLSKRYVEMRDELSEMFTDNENEFYQQMERMNLAFQQALNNTCLTPIYSFKQPEHEIRAFTQAQEAERIRWEAEVEKKWAESEQYNKNVQAIMANFRENLLNHTNTFYESFINSIQTNDYDTAFKTTMNLLKSSETTSYNEIGYSDMVRIMDVLNNVPIEFDEQGSPTKMRYNSADESFRELIKDDSIPYSARKTIADMFNFYIRAESIEIKDETNMSKPLES